MTVVMVRGQPIDECDLAGEVCALKTHLVMIWDLVGKIPCSRARIQCSVEIIPCSGVQGISLEAFEFARV